MEVLLATCALIYQFILCPLTLLTPVVNPGYYGDGMNDIIVFSSCYLPENCLENYQYVMDNLFR